MNENENINVVSRTAGEKRIICREIHIDRRNFYVWVMPENNYNNYKLKIKN